MTHSKARLRRLSASVIGATLALLLALAAPASAHSELVSSDPAAGSTVDSVPSMLTLTFNEDLQGPTAKVGVLIGDGDPVQIDAPVDGATVRVDTTAAPLAELVAKGGSGKWALAYQVVSDDGHPVDGTLTFTVDGPAASGSEPASASEPAGASESAGASQSAKAPASAADSVTDDTEKSDPLIIFLVLAGVAAAVWGVVTFERSRRTRSAVKRSRDDAAS